MKKGDIVLHEGVEVEIVRGAPVRFGERRAIVKRLSDGKSYAVTLRHLTQRAVDVACTCDILSVMGGVMIRYKKDCPIASHATNASR